ncbi:alpha/beta fold hydrolase [Pseudalkalibacillus berkeleyi]|uniref:Alpha/beta hydrolase n=1 Tax=Pseudalkalibacillus berkeleyi TaxID=1069813 RepID=A0ABS9H0R9_9BACL|nr:alpha/beta hydrolase [Pseudalkalibacillus berkeleyi]MCF6138598.1 alpha/beta hydrolase [Pseudalkalibacillus berkeleyi]
MTKWKGKIVETNRGKFEIFIRGEGKPVCVAHHYSEFNETGDHFANTFTHKYKTILINLRGTGRSEGYKLDKELSMEETVKDLEAIRVSLGYEQWSFAGHSTGGMLGLRYAIDHPNSLNYLIVVGSAASGNYADTEESIYHPDHPDFEYMQDLIIQLKSKSLHPDERKLIARERTKLSLSDPEKYESYFSADLFKKIAPERLSFFSEHEFSSFDFRKDLPSVQTPTLIICGENDVQCPIRYSEEMHQLMEQSTFIRFQFSNHYPFLEEKERFQMAVRSFMS